MKLVLKIAAGVVPAVIVLVVAVGATASSAWKTFGNGTYRVGRDVPPKHLPLARWGWLLLGPSQGLQRRA